ncbi:MAG: phospholipase D [uncultured archaeon A07HN63]|nr:MAG: phospholipase D [uncultured archaeon A07HN63]
MSPRTWRSARRLLWLLLICGLLLGGPAATAAASDASDHSPDTAGRIVELYPNPTTDGNRGEYATVRLSEPGDWTLTDGEGTVRLPSDKTGRFAATWAPDQTTEYTDATPVAAGGSFRLAVSGETLRLKRDDRVVDTVRYTDAPESEQWRADAGWQPLGFTRRAPVTARNVSVTSFVLPDDPAAPVDAISDADERLYLAAYTLTDERVIDALLAADQRGVDTAVLVEGDPVGGMTTRQAAALDRLAAGGVAVNVMTGAAARFRFHHAKYAVADDRAVVLTENWKPAGTGGASSRGWGVTVDSERVADELAAIFDHDTTWKDTPRWTAVRSEIETVEADPSTGSYPQRHPPQPTTADAVRVLAAPDNAESELVELIDRTDDRLLVVQPSIGSADYALLRAAMRAAERGVTVQILLGGNWYNEDENEQLADQLRTNAADSEMPLSVRIAPDNRRFGKIHAKGIVADDTAVVGSLNWNNNSAENNRELAVAITDPGVADYYRNVFMGDWQAGSKTGWLGGALPSSLPAGLLVVAVGVSSVTVLIAHRRLEFAER